jgi:hypothetical protein
VSFVDLNNAALSSDVMRREEDGVLTAGGVESGGSWLFYATACGVAGCDPSRIILRAYRSR